MAVMAKLIRLDKYLVEMNKGSRSQIKEAAKKGRIQVNGVPEKKTERKIDPDTDQVMFDGAVVSYRALEYIMLYKPQGVISATEDKHHKTVIDLLSGENRSDLFPVGRLDIDTEGLLLLTNDGDLTHRLLAPGKHVDKVYSAKIEGVLPKDCVKQMAEGITLTDGTPVMPAKLEVTKQWSEQAETSAGAEILLTIQEGKFHQVKRMFEALGCHVVFLKRLSMGSLKLDPSLKPGEYRALTEKELQALTAPMVQPAADPARTSQKDPESTLVPTSEKTPTVLDNLASAKVPAAGQALEQMDAVLFDLDGTLVDSMWMWKEIDIEYLGSFGLTCPPDLQKVIEGMSFSETAEYFKERFEIPDSIDEIKQTWIRMSIEKYRKEVPLKTGAMQLLTYLKQTGKKAGIATSNGRDMVDAVLESLHIKSYFQVIATACEVAAGKPAPDIYLEVAKRLGVKPAKCMVFEDVPAGILAGKRAGMTVCAVEDEFSLGMREEKEALADYYISDFTKLFDIER